MTFGRRWLVVLAAVGALASLPTLVAALPVPSRSIGAAALLARIQDSSGVGYSGYAESAGGLDLPVTSQFGGLADLFGGRTQLRVWWRSGQDWRVDSVGVAGETDTHTTREGSWRWNYEANTATFVPYSGDPRVRLPADADLLPPQLGRRLLSEARPAEASRIGTRRIAGRVAAGLRVEPAQAASTVDRVEVWADPSSGLPLAVAVYGKGGGTALTSRFLDLDLNAPPPASTRFTPPDRAAVQTTPSQDLASAIDQLGGATPPPRLAGFDRNRELPTLGSIGVYGRGVTEFAVVPLPRRVAYSLHDELQPKSDDTAQPVRLAAGPIELLLGAADEPAGPWLLVGTVAGPTLTAALAELPAWEGVR